MHIIEVIPLTLLPNNFTQLLSYFCLASLPKGAVVEVLINRRRINAVVIDSSPIEEEKMSLKKSAFQIKNIQKIVSLEPVVSDFQFKMAAWMAKTYAAPLGICLKTVLPSFFLKKGYAEVPFQKTKDENIKPFYITVPTKKMADAIEETVAQTVRAGGQVLIIGPELSSLENYIDSFKKKYNPTIIHGRLKTRELYQTWQKVADGNSLTIGSRLSLFAPYKNLKLIIVEDPGHEAFKSDMVPLYRAPELARKVAEFFGSELIYLSPIPDVISYYRTKNHDFIFKNLYPRQRMNIELIDMAGELRSGNFSVLSRRLTTEVEKVAKSGKSILIFSTRKGYASILNCGNCGLLAKCPQCSAPLRVYKIPELHLLCHHCLQKVKFPKICTNCSSYKLKITGLPGTQKISEELEKNPVLHAAGLKPIIFDATVVKDNSNEEKDLIKKIAENQTLLVASQMIFSHRYRLNFNLIGVPSADGLATMPEYRTEEKVLYQLTKLADFKPESLFLQTYNPNNRVFSAFVHGDWQTMYEDELQSRKMFSYPPFSKIVKMTYAHQDQIRAQTDSRILVEKLKMVISQLELTENVDILGPTPAFIFREKNRYFYHIVIKLKNDEKLEKVLKFVPPGWRIDVDPNELL